MEGVILLETATASCKISLYAAHVLSWTVKGKEQLFLSSKAVLDSPPTAIRGGIPLCWPQFGGFDVAEGAPGKKHGFVRNSPGWEIAEKQADSCVLTLTPDDEMMVVWPHKFLLRYSISIQGASLKLALEVVNTSDAPLEFTGCLHSYWRCSDVAMCTVQGLQGTKVDVGIGTSFSGVSVEDRHAVPFQGEVEMIFADATDAVMLMEAGQPRLKVTKSNWDGWVLWNIGAEKAGGMKDLGDGEWIKYVCVEPVASKAVKVEPGKVWIGIHEAHAY